MEDTVNDRALITCVETRECHGGPRVKHIVATIAGEDFEAEDHGFQGNDVHVGQVLTIEALLMVPRECD